MGSFEVEYDEVGEVGSMFVFSAKDEKFVTLVEGSSMACLN